MFLRTIRNDILRNKAITLTIVIFVAAAAMLVSLAATLVVNLAGAIDSLMTQAETPHFMQMHSGELDATALEAFAAQYQGIDEFQTLEFLNMDGAKIVFEEKSLADSLQDNGFAVQSDKFDFLLDLDGNVIQVADGEVYVPLCYLQDGTASLGEKVRVAGKEFTVAGFHRDSQMNSLLASSKRFLVSEKDYAALKEQGSLEYLIEFRLQDPTALSPFEAAYTGAGLAANGPTITYPLFRMMNGLSDGLMIAVILLISGLVVAIAFLCIRFTLLAKIEEDYREIGVMKAIGLPVAQIKRLYLSQYAGIAGVGSLLGFGFSFAFRGLLLENIRLYMGDSENSSLALLLGVMGVLLIFLVIVAYVNSVLKRFQKISPAEAIRFGIAQEKSSGSKRFHLSTNRLLSVNVFLGMQDVLTRKKMYATMLAVLVLAAFIIIVPQNLHTTISSQDFITYMGVGNSDLRLDIQQSDQIGEKARQIAAALENDRDIARYVVLTTKTFPVRLPDGSEERIKVEAGDHSVFPLNYAAGRSPDADDEIALSVMNADEMGKEVGDVITLVVDGQDKNFRVSGIYSDVTNGGKTAKAVFADSSAEIMWSVVSAELVDEGLIDQKIAEYAERFDFAKVSGIEAFIAQTYGATIRSVGMAAYAAMGIALSITVLITLLFMRMLIVKDRYSIAVMKAFGFRNTDVTAQYVTRSLLILLFGVLIGTLLANTLGEVLAGAVIAMFGASTFAFVVNPFAAYLLSPLMMAGAVLLATFVGTSDAGRMSIAENIKE